MIRILRMGSLVTLMGDYGNVQNSSSANFNTGSWIIIATQLAVALLSNLFLYLNMNTRVGFSMAQTISIIEWHVHTCLGNVHA